MSATRNTGTRNAIVALALVAVLFVPALRKPASFTGAYVSSTRSGGAPRSGGWDFAPLPGVRIGVDAEGTIAGTTGPDRTSVAVGSRLGAMIGPSTLVYVRAGYARVAAAPDQRRRGLLLGAGVEKIAAQGRATKEELRFASFRPAGSRRQFVSQATYRL